MKRSCGLALVVALLAAPSWAAVEFAANGNSTVTAGTGTCTPSTTTLGAVGAGDVILLVVTGEHDRAAHALTTPNGFTQVGSTVFGGDGDATEENPEIGMSVWWVRGSSWTAAPVVTDTGDHTTCALHRFTGALTSGNPWNVTSSGNDSNGNDTSALIPGATTTVTDTLVVAIFATSNNATSTANCGGMTNADLGSITERFDSTNTSNLGGGHCLVTGTKASASSYADSTLTLSATSFKGGITLALAPAPVTEFVFVAACGNNNTASATTLDCSASLNVAAGDLLVMGCHHEGAATTLSGNASDGAPDNPFTFDGADYLHDTGSNDMNLGVGYVLSAAADATMTPRCTYAAARVFRTIIVAQFRPAAGETVTKDDSSIAQGNSTTINSGTITTTGTDEVALGFSGEYQANSTTAEQINGVAATEPAGSPQGEAAAWYRVLTATFAAGAATATMDTNNWIGAVIAFKSESGAPPACMAGQSMALMGVGCR